MPAVLFVCLGNICRSPAAEGLLRHQAGVHASDMEIRVASCGIGSWHIGQRPDSRMRRAAEERGVHLTKTAQQFHEGFWEEFDYILGADNGVIQWLKDSAPDKRHHDKNRINCSFATG